MWPSSAGTTTKFLALGAGDKRLKTCAKQEVSLRVGSPGKSQERVPAHFVHHPSLALGAVPPAAYSQMSNAYQLASQKYHSWRAEGARGARGLLQLPEHVL
mmetsp:Transcript_28951/g.53254  ORF Transcript_28951/g.53254 Transcript_28951/m.53254 type:complete len:101 (-) Transcript_28951:171-473(-)